MKKTVACVSAALTAVLGVSLTTTPVAQAAILPGPGYTVPEISDPHCTLTKKDPYPIVLIHGTWANAQKWKYLTPYLRQNGMCVWALNFGYNEDAIFEKYRERYAVQDVDTSLKEIDAYVKIVMRKTGAKKVNVAAHSQGGLLVKLWIYKYKANRYVNNAVLITPTLKGTDMDGKGAFGPHKYPILPEAIGFFASPPAEFQLWDSPTIAYAKSIPDTMPGVHYASLMTKDDKTATPYTTGMMKSGPGATVQNVVIQDVCRVDHEITHSGMIEDPIARPVILRALRNQPANCKSTPWEVPNGWVGKSHKGENNGFAGDAGQSDYTAP